MDDLGPGPAEFLASVDLILHAGDVLLPSVLDWCEQFAEVHCSLGNNDRFQDPRAAPRIMIEQHGWRIGMIHDVDAVPARIRTQEQLRSEIYGERDLDVLLAGDSHYERLAYRDGVLFMDPGSPVFPHNRESCLGSMGLLEVTADGVRAEIVTVGETPGTANPSTPAHISMERGHVIDASVAGRAVEVPGWKPPSAPPLPL